MPEKDPSNWEIGTWVLLLTVSALGGLSSWYQRVKAGRTRACNAVEFVGEIATSGLMGFVGFAVGIHYIESDAMAAALAGMSAHFSTRILFQAEGLLEKLAKKLGDRIDDYNT